MRILQHFAAWAASVTVLLAPGAGVHVATAGVVRVPDDISTLLAAADSAGPGDSILVSPGTWTDLDGRWVSIRGSLNFVVSAAFLKPGVALVGVDGPESTVVDAGTGYIALLIDGPPSSVTRVEGLTLTGQNEGLVADETDGGLEISNCRFVDCGKFAVGTSFGLIDISDCTFERVGYLGDPLIPLGAVQIWRESSLELRNTVFRDNEWSAIELKDCPSVVIEDCGFYDHSGISAGALNRCLSVEIRRSEFVRNTTPGSGGALAFGSCDQVTIEFCTFAFDSTIDTGWGGAVSASSSNLSLTHNTFFECYDPYGGSAVSLGGGDVHFSHNVIVNCRGAPALIKSVAPPDSESGCNLLWNNEAGNYQGMWTAHPDDFTADPQFCDPSVLDFTVAESSPCLPANNSACAPVGAWGMGCEGVAVEGTSWGRIKSLYRETRP